MSWIQGRRQRDSDIVGKFSAPITPEFWEGRIAESEGGEFAQRFWAWCRCPQSKSSLRLQTLERYLPTLLRLSAAIHAYVDLEMKALGGSPEPGQLGSSQTVHERLSADGAVDSTDCWPGDSDCLTDRGTPEPRDYLRAANASSRVAASVISLFRFMWLTVCSA